MENITQVTVIFQENGDFTMTAVLGGILSNTNTGTYTIEEPFNTPNEFWGRYPVFNTAVIFIVSGMIKAKCPKQLKKSKIVLTEIEGGKKLLVFLILFLTY